MTITGGGDSYTVTCDLVTAEGCNVTASYTGSIALTDSSGETGDAVSTLTGDYTLDLDGATAEASFYGDYYGTGGGNWTISILPTTGPDGLLIDLVAGEGSFDGGITSGTYTAADNDYPAPGEYLRGMVSSDGGLGGTIYVGDFDSEGYVYAYAPPCRATSTSPTTATEATPSRSTLSTTRDMPGTEAGAEPSRRPITPITAHRP